MPLCSPRMQFHALPRPSKGRCFSFKAASAYYQAAAFHVDLHASRRGSGPRGFCLWGPPSPSHFVSCVNDDMLKTTRRAVNRLGGQYAGIGWVGAEAGWEPRWHRHHGWLGVGALTAASLPVALCSGGCVTPADGHMPLFWKGVPAAW